jgi:hypothetical protein
MASLTIPNPYTNPKPYDTLEIEGAEQEFVWPPETNDDTERYGIVEWSSFKTKAKIDKKAKSGAAKPKVSKTGGEGIDFSFTLVVIQSDDALESVAPVVDALRLGSTWALKRQPDAALVGVTDFIVESLEVAPPSDGVKRYVYSCTQIDQDAQNGKGANATSTPSESQYEQLYRAEFERQQGIARNLQAAEYERRVAIARQAADAAGNYVDKRTAAKMSAAHAGVNEIDVTNVQPREPNKAAVAEGTI